MKKYFCLIAYDATKPDNTAAGLENDCGHQACINIRQRIVDMMDRVTAPPKDPAPDVPIRKPAADDTASRD